MWIRSGRGKLINLEQFHYLECDGNELNAIIEMPAGKRAVTIYEISRTSGSRDVSVALRDIEAAMKDGTQRIFEPTTTSD